jgi:hypothetical protein
MKFIEQSLSKTNEQINASHIKKQDTPFLVNRGLLFGNEKGYNSATQY